MALRRYNARKDARQRFEITGYDPNNESEAREKGAADSYSRSITSAVSNKDVIVIALPYRDAQAAYRLIGSDLRTGAVVLDLSPLKLPSQAWAAKHLKGDVYAIGIAPILNPDALFDGLDDTAHAAADLFDKGAMLLMPHPKAPKESVELAAHFSELLGAAPRFADPAEFDVWAAAMEGIPAALGIAAFYTHQRRHDWDDARRAGNPAFGRLTHHLWDSHPDDLRELLLNNRDNMVRQLDETVESLRILRDLLAQGDSDALEVLLIESAKTYAEWVARRRAGRWDDDEGVKHESSSDIFLSGLFGSAVSKRLRRQGDEEDK
jgi:prephenate dehydrogenase